MKLPLSITNGDHMNKHHDLLIAFSQAPEDQIDGRIAEMFADMAKQMEVPSDQMLAVLDQCAYYALASTFAMVAMNRFFLMLCEDEGITAEQANAAAEPRRAEWDAVK
jgi:hypothetical protein